MEFMMAMQGPANDWWMTLSEVQQNDYFLAAQAFEAFYGGDETAMARAISALNHMKQGKETMQDFGPKLLLVITTITRDNFQLQMHYFHQAVNEEVGRAVIPTKPQTIHEAVQNAIDMERNMNHFGSSLNGTRNTPYLGGQATGPIGDPMDVDLNFQRSKKSYKKNFKDSGKKRTCLICDRENHIAKDCYYLKKARAAMPSNDYKKEKSPKTIGMHRNNLQQVTSMSSGNIQNESIYEQPLDITDNLFYKLYQQNTQGCEDLDTLEELYIPSEVGGSKEGTNFSLTSSVFVKELGKTLSTSVLIDTGAMISTISRDEADRLHLVSETTPPIMITYGNSSKGLSQEAVQFPCYIDGAHYQNAYLRLTNRQNVPIILGMDWLLKTRVLVDPWKKTLIPRTQAIIRSIEAFNINTQHSSKATEDNVPGVADAPKEIQAVLLLYPTLYNDEEVQTITNAPVSHRIDTGDANPIVRKGRRLSPKESSVVENEVQKLLKRGVIRISNSPWSCSPPIVIPKPDGTNRFVNNFRALNAITRKDKFPLERMEDLLDKISGSKWFTVIDLKSAYWQIPIHEDDKCKTAFNTGNALYEYNVLAQGLCNAPPTFARFMHQILQSVSSYTIIYLDDLLCHAKTKEENTRQVTEVLRLLNHWNMKISIKKCQWLCQEVKFLGFMKLPNSYEYKRIAIVSRHMYILSSFHSKVIYYCSTVV
ncbi:hypothetical protein G6F16_012356 [Rhizopus arrhizus]|nr:hypothetical protein G6F16_012356 [Rhizopus arrhizus]